MVVWTVGSQDGIRGKERMQRSKLTDRCQGIGIGGPPNVDVCSSGASVANPSSIMVHLFCLLFFIVWLLLWDLAFLFFVFFLPIWSFASAGTQPVQPPSSTI